MLVRIYETLWALIALAAVALYVTGNFDVRTAIIFGFICLGMIFMGMISVLPFAVGPHSHPKH